MVKESNFIKMEHYYLILILLMINLKVMEDIILKMVSILLDNFIMALKKEKEKHIIKMVKLNVMEILLMVNMKNMENIFGKM